MCNITTDGGWWDVSLLIYFALKKNSYFQVYTIITLKLFVQNPLSKNAKIYRVFPITNVIVASNSKTGSSIIFLFLPMYYILHK